MVLGQVKVLDYLVRLVVFLLISWSLNLCADLAWFVITIVLLFEGRAERQLQMDGPEQYKENSWGFGQVVALVATSVPFWTAWLLWTRKSYLSAFEVLLRLRIRITGI